MKKDHYIAILKYLRGYEVAGRCSDDDTDGSWFQKKNRLRKLSELEHVMFQPTLDIVMNRKCGDVHKDKTDSQLAENECQMERSVM